MIPAFYDILLRGLPGAELRVAHVVHGVGWTAAVLDDGIGGYTGYTDPGAIDQGIVTIPDPGYVDPYYPDDGSADIVFG